MQERLQQEMSRAVASQATAGGGMVTVIVNGHKHLQKLTIDPEVVSKDDVGMLQDLIVAAVNDAQRKVDEAMKQQDGRPARAACRLPGTANVSLPAPRPCSNSSISSSSCPASAPRARSGWRSTSCARRARTPSGCARRSATSRTASPTARSATTSPTSIRAALRRRPRAISASSASSKSRRTSTSSRRPAGSAACITC